MSKPILYTFQMSVWAAVPELALVELGYTDEDVEKKVINLVEGANFSPVFLEINPKGTLPTLAVGDKTYISTAEVTAYLVQNSKVKVKAGSDLIAKIHEDLYDPNFPLLLARDDEELNIKASGFQLHFLSNRQAALEKHSVHEDAVDHKDFYNDKLAGNGHALSVYQSQVPEHVKNEFFKTSKAHWDSLRSFILNILPTYLHASGFIGGVVPGEDDFHVAAWLARIAAASGAKEAGEGIQLMQKEVGSPIPMKVVSYWNAWAQRESWAKVYGSGLH